MARHIKKGDMVKIITGEDKGATARVLHVYPSRNKVVVQGHNVAKKHVRPSRRNPQGGRINVEQPIDISNVLVIDPQSSRATRVRFRLEKDGSKKRVTTSGKEISVVKRAKTES